MQRGGLILDLHPACPIWPLKTSRLQAFRIFLDHFNLQTEKAMHTSLSLWTAQTSAIFLKNKMSESETVFRGLNPFPCRCSGILL